MCLWQHNGFEILLLFTLCVLLPYLVSQIPQDAAIWPSHYLAHCILLVYSSLKKERQKKNHN